MPTRASRRDRNRKGDDKPSLSGADEVENRVRRDSPPLSPAADRPAPSDCAIGDSTLPQFEAEIGPVPEGIQPGQVVKFEYQGAWYEVAVPEGCEAGSNFRVALAKSSAASMNKSSFEEGSPSKLDTDGLLHSDDSTCCVGDSDPSELEEDPMWSTDWTAERPVCDQDLQTVEESHLAAEWSNDSCVEQQLDSIAFDNHRLPDPCKVYDLSDINTWFTRLQQRREQALRSGKTKLVRKINREIDVELEKSRQQGSTESQATICYPQENAEDDPTEFDGIWAQDWSSLGVAGCID